MSIYMYALGGGGKITLVSAYTYKLVGSIKNKRQTYMNDAELRFQELS